MTGTASVAGPRLLAAADPTLASFYNQPWWLELIKVLFIFVFLLLLTLFMIWAERRVIGRMQQRPGPNRAGKFGLPQSLMDGVKLALKEDIVPRGVDKLLFWLAPAIAVIPAFISFAIIPFGPEVSIFGVHTPLQLADLPVAVLLVLAMSSMGVYGIVLAGWASESPVPAARRAALVGPGDQLRDRDGAGLRPGLPVLRLAVHHRHRDRAGARHRAPLVRSRTALPVVVRGAAVAVFRDLPDHHGRRDQPAAVRPARG